MFKSLTSVAEIFMYLTIKKFKQVLRSQKGLDYHTALLTYHHWCDNSTPRCLYLGYLPVGRREGYVLQSS